MRALRLGDVILERAGDRAAGRSGTARRPARRDCPTAGRRRASGTVSPSSARAAPVSTSRCGCSSAHDKPVGHRQADDVGRVDAAAREHEAAVERRARRCRDARRRSRRLRPPSRTRSSTSSGAGRPSSSLTATTAATALAPLLPMPLASGMPFVNRQADAPARRRVASSSACTAAPAVLRAGSRDSRPPSPSMATISTPGAVDALGDDDVAGRVERKAEDVEAAADVRDGRGRKRGDHRCRPQDRRGLAVGTDGDEHDFGLGHLDPLALPARSSARLRRAPCTVTEVRPTRSVSV